MYFFGTSICRIILCLSFFLLLWFVWQHICFPLHSWKRKSSNKQIKAFCWKIKITFLFQIFLCSRDNSRKTQAFLRSLRKLMRPSPLEIISPALQVFLLLSLGVIWIKLSFVKESSFYFSKNCQFNEMCLRPLTWLLPLQRFCWLRGKKQTINVLKNEV